MTSSNSFLPFLGKNVLVTGSSRGIGRETALEIARQGANVAINYLRKKSAAQEVVSEILSMERCSMEIKCDVGKKDEVREMFSCIKKEFGYLDILVLNAAIATFSDITEISEKQLDFTTHANTGGILWCVQEALPLMAGPEHMVEYPTIITISSAGVYKHLPNAALYTVAKDSVEALTRYLAFDFLNKNKNINVSQHCWRKYACARQSRNIRPHSRGSADHLRG